MVMPTHACRLACCLVLVAACTAPALAQNEPLWSLPGSSPWGVHHLTNFLGGDTSRVRLKQVLLSTEPDTMTAPGASQALALLIGRYGVEERDFILDYLRRPVFLGVVGGDSVYVDASALRYNRVLGHFGDAGALAGMDSVVTFGPSWERILALSLLHEASQRRRDPQRRWEAHFDIVRQAFEQGARGTRIMSLLQSFALLDGPHVALALDLLEDYARDPDTQNPSGQSGAASTIRERDEQRGLDILEDLMRTESSPGARFRFYQTLMYVDPAGHVARTRERVPLETHVPTRSSMLGTLSNYLSGLPTVMTTPSEARFLLEWLPQEPDSALAASVASTLERFRPYPPGSRSMSGNPPAPAAALDGIAELVDTMATYEWVSPAAFADTLHAHIDDAQAAIAVNDTSAALIALAAFQAAVDEAYEQPQPGVREATREGHRFLWWTAQYLIDRLE
jgi:hypothetical protein